MENGADIVDGLHTGDTKSLGTSEERVEEGVVFEDAMNADEDFLEQKMNSDSADAVVKEEGEEQPAGDSKHSMVYEDPNSVYQVDKLEEATDGFSLTSQNREEVNDEGKPSSITTKEEVYDDGASVLEPIATRVVDEEGSEVKVKSAFNELPNGLSSHEDGGKEFSEVGARNEGEILDEDETDDANSSVTISESGVDVVNEKLEESVSMDETANSTGVGKEGENDRYTHRVTESNREILDENEAKKEKVNLNCDVETTGELQNTNGGHQVEEPVSMDETADSTGAGKEGEDDRYTHRVTESNREILDENEVKKEKVNPDCDEETTGELQNTNGGHQVEILDNRSEKPIDDCNLINADAKFADKESGELEDSTASSKSRSENVEGDDLSYSSTQKEHMDYNVEEVNNASVVVDSGDNGDTSEASTANLERNGLTTSEVKYNSADLPKTVDITEVEAQNGTPSPANVNNEKTVKTHDVKTGLIAMDNHIDKSQQLDDYGKSSIIVEKLEKAEGKVQEENQGTRSNTDVGVQPSPNLLPLSSKKVSNPAPSPARPAGLGRAAPLLEPALRTAQQPRVNGNSSHMQSQQVEDSSNGEAEENDETREKLQMIRVKFLRLAHRLGQTPHNVVVAQVLYRLGLAEQLQGRSGGRVGAFSFDRASAMAEQLEAAGQEPLDFSCTIMVLGKTGVGKSATINSIFDEVKFGTDAFQIGTKKVQDVVGTVQGIKVRVIDTPGLLSSWSDQRQNEKILLSVKRLIKKTPPDIVLYLDRLDVQNRDFSDMPLLRTITDIFGPSIWFNAIVVFTHSASAPPDGPNGVASSYDMFVTQRSHVVQQAIRQAAGDMRLMNPVSLVENHSACRTNRAGQRVLPNGQVWKPHLLLLSFASKILAEANALLKLQDSPPGRPFTARSRAPPLPFLLSSLLQSRPQVKLPEEQFADGDDIEDELDESSDSEEESEYDELPPFKRLTKAQVSKLSKVQKKAYFDELEYREKLFMKKQLKEEKRRRKMMKKMAAQIRDLPSDYAENAEEESNGAASVPVPMPDLALPASFDSDNPTHRYRYLDSSNQWLIRPVLETHGWDHDVGYEGINVEKLFVIKERIPLSFSGQVTKDKKDANLQMEMTSSIKHGEGKATSFGFDMQTVGKDMAYTLRGERIFCNFWKNKAIAGISATLLGDTLSGGVKVEDKLIAGKRFRLVIAGGAMTSRGDVAYGGSLEAQLRDKEHPLGRSLSTLGLSVMDWHGDLAIGCNLQSQIPIGRSTTLIGRANLNNRGAGQVSIRINSSEQLQIALLGLVPLVKKIFGYHQQL